MKISLHKIQLLTQLLTKSLESIVLLVFLKHLNILKCVYKITQIIVVKVILYAVSPKLTF